MPSVGLVAVIAHDRNGHVDDDLRALAECYETLHARAGRQTAPSALSFNRNMWIGAVFGLALLLLMGGGRLRRGVVLVLMATASLAAAALLVGLERDRDSALVPVIARGETLLDPGALERENSLQDRFSESGRAWEAFTQRPLTGIGVGTSFGVFSTTR